jgi:hypothetical protein
MKYRRSNQKWTNQRNRQHRVHTARREVKQKTTQYMFDTTLRKQTQITHIRHEPSYKQLQSRLSYLSLIYEISMTIYNYILLQSCD